ncbi:nucleotide sugar dehydrogenase [Anaerosalibacter massiliensis]|uniref:nucleotide sugar dehydrogenase n=1 Tax=Anaerosalibacter massiliensis TaxID=1347392 RepID=UPI0005B2ADDE|nr:nucleotide sugar dehydrogenase [Anaerosalibacter massiliensis]
MKQQKICVIGLGYIGLPTSAMFATHGCEVVGVDINGKVVEALSKGKIIIEEPYLDIMVQAAVRSGHLKAKRKPETADVFIISVPTPITKDKKADMSYVVKATEMIVPYLRKGNLVILESTSPTGTVEELVVPILEKSGLKIGEELYVGHSPERVLPGKILWELVNNNRIVGGINRISAEKIRDLYKIFVNGEIYLTNATTAEMCKMMENTFRDVNIALANELAKICEKTGINVWEVIELCNKHPRVNIHQPGPGVGGHCLAVDPWFIIEKNPELAKIIELSRKTNDNMPYYVLDKIDEILKDIKGNKKVTILGMTYKPNIDDVRESPILKLIDLIDNREDLEINVYDPHVGVHKYQEKDLMVAAKDSDLLILAVNHDVFRTLPLSEIAKVMRNRNFFDTRNFMDKEELEHLGFKYILLGEKAI